jgi:hypothetical protein
VGRNGIAGLVCLAISAWLLFLTRGLPPPIMVPIGPAFYPRLVLSCMALLSVLLIVGDWRTRRRRRGAPTTTPAKAVATRPNYLLVAATFVVFTIYVVLLPLLGFRIATLFFVAALQVTLDGSPARRSWRYWLRVALVAIATTLICDLAFERYLSVLLPRGRWTDL